MFRARKPSLRRSQLDETPRKRARVNSPAVKASPLAKATPIAKASSSDKKKKGSSAKPSTKSKAKTQSRIRFPAAKDKKPVEKIPVAEKPVLHSKAEPVPREDAKERKATREGRHGTRSVPVTSIATSRTVECVPQVLISEGKLEESVGAVEKPEAFFTSRKKLDFGPDSPHDDLKTASSRNESTKTSDTQSQELSPVTNFWPPYEPSEELLCRAHDHRLIKPEDDPILDAALELLL